MARYSEPQAGIDIDTKLVNDPDTAQSTHRQRIIAVDEDGADALADIKRSISDYEVRLDYDVRTDGNPVYVGKAAQAASTASAVWVIQKLDYDGSNRLTRVQVLNDAVWDNRAALGWS